MKIKHIPLVIFLFIINQSFASHGVHSELGYTKFITGEKGIAFSQRYYYNINKILRIGGSYLYSQGSEHISNSTFSNQLNCSRLAMNITIAPVIFKKHQIGLEGNLGMDYLIESSAIRKVTSENDLYDEESFPFHTSRDIYDVVTTIYLRPGYGWSFFYAYHFNNKWFLSLQYGNHYAKYKNAKYHNRTALTIGFGFEINEPRK